MILSYVNIDCWKSFTSDREINSFIKFWFIFTGTEALEEVVGFDESWGDELEKVTDDWVIVLFFFVLVVFYFVLTYFFLYIEI